MTYAVAQRAGHVEVEGATSNDVRTGLELLVAARELQYQNAAQAREHLTHVLVAAGVDLVPPSSLEQARRLQQVRAGLLATPVLDYETLAELRDDAATSATRTAVSRQRAAQHIFTVTVGGRTLFPAFQLTENGAPRADLAPLLSVLIDNGVQGWQLWTWLVSPTPFLSGGVPHQIAGEDPARALRAAQRFAARR